MTDLQMFTFGVEDIFILHLLHNLNQKAMQKSTRGVDALEPGTLHA